MDDSGYSRTVPRNARILWLGSVISSHAGGHCWNSVGVGDGHGQRKGLDEESVKNPWIILYQDVLAIPCSLSGKSVSKLVLQQRKFETSPRPDTGIRWCCRWSPLFIQEHQGRLSGHRTHHEGLLKTLQYNQISDTYQTMVPNLLVWIKPIKLLYIVYLDVFEYFECPWWIGPGWVDHVGITHPGDAIGDAPGVLCWESGVSHLSGCRAFWGQGALVVDVTGKGISGGNWGLLGNYPNLGMFSIVFPCFSIFSHPDSRIVRLSNDSGNDTLVRCQDIRGHPSRDLPSEGRGWGGENLEPGDEAYLIWFVAYWNLYNTLIYECMYDVCIYIYISVCVCAWSILEV